MTNLEQLHLFLKFHFAPWGAAKGEIWESLTSRPYEESVVQDLCARLIDGRLVFEDFDIKMLRIVAEPGPPDDVQWANKMRWAGDPDRGAGHIDADWLLVNLLNELGYTKTTAEWIAIDKQYGVA